MHEPSSVEDVRRTLDRLRAAQELAHIGAWEFEVKTGKWWASHEFLRIYGFDPQGPSPTRQELRARLHPDDFQRVEDATNQALESLHGTLDLEYRIRRKDGEERRLRAIGRATADGGAVRGLVGAVQDVTEQRRLDDVRMGAQAKAREIDRLKEQNAFKSQFINIAAHELKTPLTPIRLQAHLLSTVLARGLTEQQQKAVSSLERNVERLQRLVEDVLQAARIQSNQLQLRQEPVDLNEPVEETVDTFRSVAEQVGIALDWHATPQLFVAADRRRFTQVVYNLLSNACKYTPRGGRITVASSREGDHAVLRVQDTGRGLSSDQIGRLFQPFTQVHQELEASAHGTGLGLYICKGIIEEHHGTISVESPGPNRGSTFTVRIPLTSSRPVAAAPVAKKDRQKIAPEVAQRLRDLI